MPRQTTTDEDKLLDWLEANPDIGVGVKWLASQEGPRPTPSVEDWLAVRSPWLLEALRWAAMGCPLPTLPAVRPERPNTRGITLAGERVMTRKERQPSGHIQLTSPEGRGLGMVFAGSGTGWYATLALLPGEGVTVGGFQSESEAIDYFERTFANVAAIRVFEYSAALKALRDFEELLALGAITEHECIPEGRWAWVPANGASSAAKREPPPWVAEQARPVIRETKGLAL